MSDEIIYARNALARLYANGKKPTPEEEAHARSALACAKLDREIRIAFSVSPALGSAQLGHLIGLLVSWGGSDDHAVERLERAIREAVDATPNLTVEDRFRIAGSLVAGGTK